MSTARYEYDALYSPEDRYPAIEEYENSWPVSESAKYYQNLIGCLRLVPNNQARDLVRRIQAGQDAQSAVDYARWAELPEDEDFTSWQELADDGNSAKEELIVGNLRLVAHVARLTMGWVPYGYDVVEDDGKFVFKGAILKDLSVLSVAPLAIEDRIQAGTEGLIRAVEKYDPSRDAKFTTYAFWHIEGSILNAIFEDQTIHIPERVDERLRKLEDASSRLLNELKREPNLEELAETARLPISQARQLLDLKRSVLALATLDTLSLNGDEASINPPGDRAIDYDAEYIDQVIAEDEVDQLLVPSGKLGGLRQRDADVVAMRYGLATGETMTLEEIGAQFGITRERVRQIEVETLRKMRTNPYSTSYSEVSRRNHFLQLKREHLERQNKIRYAKSLIVAAQVVRAAHSAAAGSD